MSAAYSPPKDSGAVGSPESFFVPGSDMRNELVKIGKSSSECVIGNKKVVEAQQFIENFTRFSRKDARVNQYSDPYHAYPKSNTDNNIPIDKWPNLMDKRFNKWIKTKFTDPKYKQKKWNPGEDPCGCPKCNLPKRTGPWKGKFCECDSKTFSGDSDNYYEFLDKVGFPHQKFIVDYFTKGSPYRGILVYHGLGSGKTCTAVALAEMLSQKRPSDRDIICMLPASLKDNYMKDLLKCGNNIYRQINKHKMDIENIMQTCSSDTEYLENILHNLEYLLSEFKNQKYHFVSYNASNIGDQLKKIPHTHLTVDELKKIPSYNPKYYESTNRFNHKILIVDECHDLISRIIGGGGKGIWDKEFYAKIMAAQDCKIIFMSGTPIQNDIFEIAITMNILRGYVGANKAGGRLMLFPNSFKDFHEKFVSEDSINIINEDIFKRRLSGLISSFQSISGFFPEERHILSHNYMSDYQFSVHEQIKNEEISREEKTKMVRRQKRDKFRGLAVGTRMFTEKESSTYSVFSRQACNFVYPDDIYRPNTLIPPPDIPLVVLQDPINTFRTRMVARESSLGGGSVADEEVDEEVDEEIYGDINAEILEGQETGTSRSKRIREYLKQVKISLQYLLARYNTALVAPNLGKYSQKMMKIIKYINDGVNLQKDINGNIANKVWDQERGAWNINLKDCQISVNSKDSTVPPTNIPNSAGPVFIYSFFKSVEGAEILSYAFYADGYVAVSDTVNLILDKINSNSKCFHCNKKFNEHLQFKEKASRLEPDLLIKVDRYLPEGEAMKEWLEKSTSLVKRKSVKAGKSGLSIVEYVKVSNLCPDHIRFEIEDEAGIIFNKLNKNDTDELSSVGVKINRLDEPYRTRAIEICRRISENKIHISNLWQIVILMTQRTSSESTHFDWRGGLTQDKVNSLKLKCPVGDNTFKPLRFVLWSGDSKKEMAGNLLLSKFNASDNKYGEEIKIMIATRVAGQGVSLMNVRQVHILEPHWNEAKIKQAIGRASRVCSHGSLPFEQRNVDVFRYFSEYNEHHTSKYLTTDSELGMISTRKNYLISKVEDIMREMSVDCNLNSSSGKCFNLNDSELSGENLLQNMYEPDIDSSIDIMRRTVVRYLPPLISRPISGMEGSQLILMVSPNMGFIIKKDGLTSDNPQYLVKKILIINKKGEITLRDLAKSMERKDLMTIGQLSKFINEKMPSSYYSVKEISIKDLSQWPSGVWSATSASDSNVVSKRPQALAFRKWQKDLYETNLPKA
jgi:hypothetical protein